VNAATRALNPELFPPDETQSAPPGTTRTNWKNDGRAFQKEFEMTAAGYEARGIASFEKVDPPVRIIWPLDKKTGKPVQRVIFQTNPFLDYIGVFTARHSLAIFIEVKSTATHRLDFNKDNGFKATQWAAMKRWRHAGAACGLLWQWNFRVCLFTPELMLNCERAGAKSLVWEDGLLVPPGEGQVIWDFLPVLEAAAMPAKNNCAQVLTPCAQLPNVGGNPGESTTGEAH
jgi:penicillin-binding protein-related factor A (putative recombinase)